MALYPSLRMTTHLNALRHLARDLAPAADRQLSAERAAAAIIGDDVAHHVVDLGERAGLDPSRATPLPDALPALAGIESEWILALPQAGALGSLRGPVALNRAALAVGEAVVASTSGIALVPHRVGQAVQWRVFAAERPFPPPSSYDAERALSEAVLKAATTLTQLDVASGRRPGLTMDVGLPGAYSPRQHAMAARAMRLLAACDAALQTDGASITSFEVEARSRELRLVRDAANQALCAAATWPVA